MKSLQASRCLVGGDKNPKNLHAYGDLDGQSEDAKLQHPLGVCFIPEKNVIAVTDTYNHKIKVIDPFNNEIFSWLGNGKATLVDDQTFDSSLNEPSGICSLFDPKEDDIKVFIADCNNHCIRQIYYDKGYVETLEIKGIPPAGNEENVAQVNKDGTSAQGNSTMKTNDTIGGALELECDGDKCYPKFF